MERGRFDVVSDLRVMAELCSQELLLQQMCGRYSVPQALGEGVCHTLEVLKQLGVRIEVGTRREKQVRYRGLGKAVEIGPVCMHCPLQVFAFFSFLLV